MRLFGKRRVRAADLEIHVPISPTEHFFTMVRYLAASLRLNGGAVAGCRLVVTVGADQEPEDLERRLPWSRHLGVEWRWLDRGLYQRSIFFATALERFRYRFQAPVVLQCDADMIVTGPLDHLVQDVLAKPSFRGLVAHVSPFLEYPQHNSEQWWARIFERAGLGAPPFCCAYTSPWFRPCANASRRCPPYFNLGVLAAPAALMNAVGETIYQEMEHVNACLDTGFRCQIGLTLALLRQRLPWQCLRVRYNCPNVPMIVVCFPQEVKKCRILHYLARDDFQKHLVFANEQSVAAFLDRTGLEPINDLLRQHLQRIHLHATRAVA